MTAVGRRSAKIVRPATAPSSIELVGRGERGSVGEDLPRTPQAVGGHVHSDHGVVRDPSAPATGVDREGHDHHVVVAQRGEVSGRGTLRVGVVEEHAGDVLPRVALHDDDRDAAGSNDRERVPHARTAADEDRRIDGRGVQRGLADGHAVVAQQEESRPEARHPVGQAVHHVSGHRVEEGGAQVLIEHDAHDARATPTERRGSRVGARVAQALGRGQHPCARRLGRGRLAAEHDRRVEGETPASRATSLMVARRELTGRCYPPQESRTNRFDRCRIDSLQ